MPDKIYCNNCGEPGEIGFGTCKKCTPKEILDIRLQIVTERLAAAEDFKILTAQLREQYITLRIAPLVEYYNELVEEYANKVASELEAIKDKELAKKPDDPEEKEAVYNLNNHGNN